MLEINRGIREAGEELKHRGIELLIEERDQIAGRNRVYQNAISFGKGVLQLLIQLFVLDKQGVRDFLVTRHDYED